MALKNHTAGSHGAASAENLVERLSESLALDYSRPDTSFCPFYSDIGLGFDAGAAGIAKLYVHYNRATLTCFEPFLRIPGMPEQSRNETVQVRQIMADGQISITFCSHDTWILESTVPGTCEFRLADPRFTETRITQPDLRTIIYDGYLPTTDQRDPDSRFPFVLGLRVLKGSIEWIDSTPAGLQLRPGHLVPKLTILFSARALEVRHSELLRRLDAAPGSVEEARSRALLWYARALGGLSIPSGSTREERVAARAVHTLVSNATSAPGLMAGRVAAFPSRGAYPTHFLWDSCFQNLALEQMHPRLAADSLLLLTENLRPDGKMAHFLCSTWVRPHETQPPLAGWAGLRLVRQRGSTELARQLLPALRRNTEWWMQQRMTRWGIVCSISGLETGWDDSPRFDHGPTAACDMNSYLLVQMRACAELARMLGDETGAARDDANAEALARRVADTLYDPETHLFFDRNLETGQPVRVKTPACFLPLWAGVPLPESNARPAIEEHLLNPESFYGKVPFPCVAYDEPCYRPDSWWRGPTWMPVAWLMLELLARYGYRSEREHAAGALRDIITADGELHELFDSQTGQGLGAREQGWTAAIYLRLLQG